MRKLLFAFLILASSVVCITNVACAEEGWFPYYFPADPAAAPDYIGVPASTFNAGKDVLDAPAGKHGFVKVKDGHFYCEDGTRARFWGTNLCFGACFPDHKDAEVMANRIAYFGFNAVRLHHMDFYFEPNGIFEDVAPAYKNKQMKPTGHLSPRQLDKLDYLIYQLKQRGIYVNINTLVSRHFTEADGVPDAEKLGMAAKPVSLFDAKLIELQKQYAKDLLTHLNPYTKLRYSDDPAICLVEINNENTLVELKISSMPEYYQKELNNLTNNGKIPLSELEKKYLKEMKDFLHNEIGVKCPIGIGGHWNPAQLRLQQECLDYVDKHAYWDHPQFPHKLWDMNDFRINNKSLLADKNLGIIGAIKKASVIARSETTKQSLPFTVSEWNHCYPNQYAYETPVALAREAAKNDWDALFQFAWSHSEKDLTNYDNVNSYFNINPNAQQLILCSYGSRIFLKGLSPHPVKVGEIKNTNSGWNDLGRFNWGTAPTLLKQP